MMSSKRPAISLKRVYEHPDETDGTRILVDRLWPRGLSKGKAKVDFWLKEIAPSTELRQWYRHDPDKWMEFKRRYSAELETHPEEVERLLAMIQSGTVTFVYSSTEEKLNNAAALWEYLEAIIRAQIG